MSLGLAAEISLDYRMRNPIDKSSIIFCSHLLAYYWVDGKEGMAEDNYQLIIIPPLAVCWSGK